MHMSIHPHLVSEFVVKEGSVRRRAIQEHGGRKLLVVPRHLYGHIIKIHDQMILKIVKQTVKQNR